MNPSFLPAKTDFFIYSRKRPFIQIVFLLMETLKKKDVFAGSGT